MAASYLTTAFLTPAWLERTLSLAPLTPAAAGYWIIAAGLFMNVGVGCAWFFGTSLFWSGTPATDRARIEGFFDRMLRPVDFAKEEGPGSDRQQGDVLGKLCLCYGAFVCLLALIPNPLPGRLAFLGCGGVVVSIGWLLIRTSRRPAAG